MITASVTHAITESFKTAYGKNGFPWLFRIWYSRRYCSFSSLFTQTPLTQTRSFSSGSLSSAFNQGGAVVPSFVTR
jgi:hypothetical protein